MIFFGYGIVTSTDYRDSDLVFKTKEEAEKYIALRDTYFFKHNSQIVELYYLPVDPLAKL
jgi:hypothetical protein